MQKRQHTHLQYSPIFLVNLPKIDVYVLCLSVSKENKIEWQEVVWFGNQANFSELPKDAMRGVFMTRKSKGEIWAKLMQNSSFEIFYHLYHKISPGILLGRTLFIHSKILVLNSFNIV